MSAFVATMTETGRELLARLREARTNEDVSALSAKYKAVISAGLSGQPGLSDADGFVFACALAALLPWSPQHRASHWEAASTIAIGHKAYPEALFALEKAQQIAGSKERQERVRLLRELVAARNDLASTSSGAARKNDASGRGPTPGTRT